MSSNDTTSKTPPGEPRNFQADFPPSRALDAAREIALRLSEAGNTAYLVGGCVRDALLGLQVGDYDIATDAPPAKVEEIFPKTFAVGAAFGVIVVRHKGQAFEVATFRSESGYADRRRPSEVKFSTPEEDVKRRDFTINGLFYDPANEVGIDYVGGIADMEARLLRTIGAPAARFEEDALRLLRAARFAARLGFEIEAETRSSLMDRVHLLREISVERIEEELTKGLKKRPADYVRLLHRLGLLDEVLPEIAALESLDVGERSALDATCERLRLLDELPDELLDRPPQETATSDSNEARFSNPARAKFAKVASLLGEGATANLRAHRAELLWAGLFFESGRPNASRRTTQGLWLGPKMMVEGHTKWSEAARRLSMSGARRGIVGNRLRDAQEWQNFAELRKWRKRELLGDPNALLDIALLGTYGEVYHTAPAPLDAALALLEKLAAKGEAPLPPPLVDGRDLMQELGLPPGPHLGELLTQIRRAQLDEKITTRKEALDFAKQYSTSNIE